MTLIKLEKNDVAVGGGSVNLFYEEGIISYPAYSGDDTIREGEFVRPGETLYIGGREGGKGKSVEGEGGVGCTRFRVPVGKCVCEQSITRGCQSAKTDLISSSVWY